ncbi:MAG: hypothetical protein ACKO2L_06755 [Planctomycetaceae bacterium]
MSAITSECCSTAASITEVLLGGDAVLNLTPQTLNVVHGTQFIGVADGRLCLSAKPAAIDWQPHFADSIRQLTMPDISRIVIITDAATGDASSVSRAFAASGIPHMICVLRDVCDADAFMDEADAEAVAERLRQLGYL